MLDRSFLKHYKNLSPARARPSLTSTIMARTKQAKAALTARLSAARAVRKVSRARSVVVLDLRVLDQVF
jgi:hypothetical protein